MLTDSSHQPVREVVTTNNLDPHDECFPFTLLNTTVFNDCKVDNALNRFKRSVNENMEARARKNGSTAHGASIHAQWSGHFVYFYTILTLLFTFLAVYSFSLFNSRG